MNEEIKTSPIEDFDWEAYEKGEQKGTKSREELTKTYDESLNTVKRQRSNRRYHHRPQQA